MLLSSSAVQAPACGFQGLQDAASGEAGRAGGHSALEYCYEPQLGPEFMLESYRGSMVSNPDGVLKRRAHSRENVV